MNPVDWRIDYFREASGRSAVESFIDALSPDEKVDTMVGIDMLRSHGVSLGRPWVAPLGKGLWELRIRTSPATSHPVLSHDGENLCPASRFCEKDP